MSSKNMLSVKVPIYLTEAVTIDETELFYGTEEGMIENAKTALQNFKLFEVGFKNKTKKVVVDGIQYHELFSSDGIPNLLLQISAYDTNINDGYCETDHKVALGSNGKIGSDTNYVLLYPKVDGVYPEPRICYFLVLVFEDPTKDAGDVQRLARIVARNILHQPIRNIKPETLLNELRNYKTIPQLDIEFTGSSINEDCDLVLKPFLLRSQLTRTKKESFSNVPSSVIDHVQSVDDEEGYFKRTIRYTFGKKQYKFTKQLKECLGDASEMIQEVAEKLFNMTTEISEDDMANRLNDPSFVYDKLMGVLENYLSSYQE